MQSKEMTYIRMTIDLRHFVAGVFFKQSIIGIVGIPALAVGFKRHCVLLNSPSTASKIKYHFLLSNLEEI